MKVWAGYEKKNRLGSPSERRYGEYRKKTGEKREEKEKEEREKGRERVGRRVEKERKGKVKRKR